jgi:hypothetical protein
VGGVVFVGVNIGMGALAGAVVLVLAGGASCIAAAQDTDVRR